MTVFYSLVLAFMMLIPQSQQQDQKARQGTYAITNARIETVSDGTIENGTVVIEGDRIIAVGINVAIPEGAQLIDGSGMHVYPGMIDSGTSLGLVEVGSVAETNDTNEVGEVTPHMDALTAVNPNAVAIPVTRVSGITTVITEPGGGLLPGTAAAINLFGYTAEQMHAGDVRMLVLQFPRKGGFGNFRRFRGGGAARDPEAEYKKAMDKLNEIWDRASLYQKIAAAYAADPSGKTMPVYAPEMDAITPVLTGDRKLMVKVDGEKDILAAINWVQERKLTNVVFSGVSEGWRVADKLAEAGIACLVGPMLATPTRGSDRYDRAYANIGLMADAGVTVAIRSGETENVRNLAFNAGFAAAYGMGKEAALKAVTLGPAQIFGIDADYGSIEVGKKANLFLSDGDPFETSTNILALFIDGFNVPIESRHLDLYQEFLNRDEGRLQPVEVLPADH
ncbi:MAG: amidohydrolase family protein [Rhodothermales bacterium]|nr:amidohydrolase family protein [Rhodothermales bacterium]MDG2017066.1 amidohydrolase family protein [Rhodothermales bacterium]